jgi:hypothetical protein
MVTFGGTIQFNPPAPTAIVVTLPAETDAVAVGVV